MIQQRKALGRGLDSLISPDMIATPKKEESTTTIPIEKIFPNPEQPRLNFDEEAITQLAQSIKKEGILQPLLVSPSTDGRYELIAGERRWRAAQMAGITQVPVIIRKCDASKKLEWALVENIQREDLNPIEEAKGFEVLVKRFALNHADIAERVGKSREHVANALRLLNLPKEIQDDVAAKKLSAGHARALLALPSIEEQLYFRQTILTETLTVRDVERMIQEKRGLTKKLRTRHKKHLSPQIKLLLDEMEKSFGTKVRLQPGAIDGKGALVIEYYSWQDLDRIYRKIVS